MAFPLEGFCPAHVHGRDAPDSARILASREAIGPLAEYRAPRKVGTWVDAPPPLEGTEEFAKKVKGFTGTFARVQETEAFLAEASPEVREATVLKIVECKGLLAKQGEDVFKSAEKCNKITVVATFEYESMRKRSHLEMHSDGGALMTTTTESDEKAEWGKTWTYDISSVEVSKENSALVVLKAKCISEQDAGATAVFELSWSNGQLRGMVGGPDHKEDFDAMFFMGKNEKIPIVKEVILDAAESAEGAAETSDKDAKPGAGESAAEQESVGEADKNDGKSKKKAGKSKKTTPRKKGNNSMRSKVSSLLSRRAE